MFITCDLYYLKDNYILHFRGNDVTSKVIEDAKNRNITRVAIKMMKYLMIVTVLNLYLLLSL